MDSTKFFSFVTVLVFSSVLVRASDVPTATPASVGGSETSTVASGASPTNGPTRTSLRELLKSWLPSNDPDDEGPAEGAAEAVDSEGGVPAILDTNAFAPTDILTADDLAHAVSWHAADFSEQNGALGWSPHAFDVPEALKVRVSFWKDVYSKYTTDQGVLHDTRHIEIIYSSLDFGSISKDPSKTTYQKARARESLIKEKKKEIIARLHRLKDHATADGLSGEDLRVWKLFEHYKEANKFSAAATKTRVRFQLGQRDRFILGVYYSGRYLRDMERVYREERLPIELTRLPFVESSFNINARSRVGASGIWQFMPRTARPYMKVNRDVDERNDPIKSTLASSRVLRQNFSMLGSWPLALTGWNHGPYGVRGIVNKLGTRDLGEIIARYSSRTFGFASENFYACFLAALEIERNAPKYLGNVKWSTEVASSELKVTENFTFRNLVEFYDGNAQLASLLNPHFTPRIRSGKVPIPRGSYIRVPPARFAVAQEFMKGKLSSAKLTVLLQNAPLPPATVSRVGLGGQQVASMTGAVRARLEKMNGVAQVVIPAFTRTPEAKANKTNLSSPEKGSAKLTLAAGSRAGENATSPVTLKDEKSAVGNENAVAKEPPNSHGAIGSSASLGDSVAGLQAKEVVSTNSAILASPTPVPPPSTVGTAVPAPNTAASDAGAAVTLPQANAVTNAPATPAQKTAAVPSATDPNDVPPRIHRVRVGENLVHIAHEYKVDIDDLRRANGMIRKNGRKRSTIQVGQMLVIPAETPPPSAPAGPASADPPASAPTPGA